MADPVDPDRLIYGGTWNGKVGVVGGIPTDRTQSGSTIDPYGSVGSPQSASTINTAITNAASGTYVLLGAGDFYLNTDILIDKSNVTLRGSVNANNVPTTIIHGDVSVEFNGTTGGWDSSNSGNFTNVNITSGHTRGSTTVTVSASPSGRPEVNALMIISAPANSPYILGGGFALWHNTNPWTQVVKVTGVSGNDISFTPAINSDYLTLGGTCKVSFRALSKTIARSGVENLYLVASGSGASRFISWFGTDECWAYNVHTDNIAEQSVHMYPYITYRTEINHCEAEHMDVLASSTYLIHPIHSSSMLVLNNYFHDCPNIMPCTGWNGSVFAYNYCNDFPYSPSAFLSQIVFAHGISSHYNLFEGNWVAQSFNDASADGQESHSRNHTFLRNRMRGYDANGPKTDNTTPLSLMLQHSNYTLAGNVLGENGVQTTYHATFTAGGSDNFNDEAILNIHTTCDATLELFNNYNTVNDAIPAGEADSGVVTSYLFDSKPSWFGDRPWPWCDPSNFTQSNTFTNLPAGYRAQNGVDPPASSGATAGNTPQRAAVVIGGSFGGM